MKRNTAGFAEGAVRGAGSSSAYVMMAAAGAATMSQRKKKRKLERQARAAAAQRRAGRRFALRVPRLHLALPRLRLGLPRPGVPKLHVPSTLRRRLPVLRLPIVIAGAVLLLAGGTGAAAAGFLLLGSGDSGPDLKTAAIVDQLDLTQPNPEFAQTTTDMLTKAGYRVDYFKGAEVTVDLYRSLPERDYDIVLLRVHAGITEEVDANTGQKTDTEYVSLFTGEAYSEDKYPEEQVNRLGRAVYYEGAEPLFGIGPEFITESMRGEFGDSLIVMMGCDGLRSQRTAQAFLDKGASAFVSWSQPVSAPHTDAATAHLLKLILEDNRTPEHAVALTRKELGPDPTYDAELRILTRSAVQAGGN